MDRPSIRLLTVAALAAAVTSCAQASLEVHDWAVIEETETGLLLLVDVGSPNCNSVERTTVTETPTTVSIEITVREKVSEIMFWGGCDAAGMLEDHSVELAEPLGDRALEGCLLGRGGAVWEHRETCREPMDP